MTLYDARLLYLARRGDYFHSSFSQTASSSGHTLNNHNIFIDEEGNTMARPTADHDLRTEEIQNLRAQRKMNRRYGKGSKKRNDRIAVTPATPIKATPEVRVEGVYPKGSTVTPFLNELQTRLRERNESGKTSMPPEHGLGSGSKRVRLDDTPVEYPSTAFANPFTPEPYLSNHEKLTYLPELKAYFDAYTTAKLLREERTKKAKTKKQIQQTDDPGSPIHTTQLFRSPIQTRSRTAKNKPQKKPRYGEIIQGYLRDLEKRGILEDAPHVSPRFAT